MIKIKTIFKRDIVDNIIVDIHSDVVEGCEWVLNEPCIATRKLDGTASAIINGRLYARLDFKNLKSKVLPDGAIPCQDQPDSITGSHPYWIPCTADNITVFNALDFETATVVLNGIYKYHYKAFKRLIETSNITSINQLDGTYELMGKHIKGNPEEMNIDTLVKHGSVVLDNLTMTFEGIKDYLTNNYIEGIVFYRSNGDMAKIKRTDFGMEWRGDKKRQVTDSFKKKRRKGRYYR